MYDNSKTSPSLTGDGGLPSPSSGATWPPSALCFCLCGSPEPSSCTSSGTLIPFPNVLQPVREYNVAFAAVVLMLYFESSALCESNILLHNTAMYANSHSHVRQFSQPCTPTLTSWKEIHTTITLTHHKHFYTLILRKDTPSDMAITSTL